MEAIPSSETLPSWKQQWNQWRQVDNTPLRGDPLLEPVWSVSGEQNTPLSQKLQEHSPLLSEVKSNYKHFSSGLTTQIYPTEHLSKACRKRISSARGSTRETTFLLKASWLLHRQQATHHQANCNSAFCTSSQFMLAHTNWKHLCCLNMLKPLLLLVFTYLIFSPNCILSNISLTSLQRPQLLKIWQFTLAVLQL